MLELGTVVFAGCVLIAQFGCSAAGDGPFQSLHEPIVTDVVYVAPDARLSEYLPEVINQYAALGFNVAVDPEGIPLIVSESGLSDGAQGVAHYRSWCYAGACTASNTYIHISNAVFQKSTGFIHNCIAHEIGHVISGWGACSAYRHLHMATDGKHLVPGNLISNGNNNYDTFVFTAEDLGLLESCLNRGF